MTDFRFLIVGGPAGSFALARGEAPYVGELLEHGGAAYLVTHPPAPDNLCCVRPATAQEVKEHKALTPAERAFRKMSAPKPAAETRERAAGRVRELLTRLAESL